MPKRAANGTGCVFQPTYTDKGVLKTSSTWWMKLPDGTKAKCEGATNEREARVLLQRRMGQTALGIAPKVGEKHLRYGELRELLLLDMQVAKLRSLRTLSDGSLSIQGLTKLDEYFQWSLNNPGDKIADYDPARWESAFILARRKEGVSDGTIINSAKLLRKMFSIAVRKNRLTVAPQVAAPKAPPAKKHVLYKEQFDLLIGPNGVPKEFIPVMTFLFYQGTRITEALKIRWRQIDLGAAVYRPNPKENKTGDSEQKILHRAVVAALGSPGDGDAFVFQSVLSEGKNLGKKIEGVFRNAMRRFKIGQPMWQCGQCKATKKDHAPTSPDSPGIECSYCKGVPMTYQYVGPSPHSLRASCVVFYLESGMNETETMKITGHTDIEVFRGYARLPEEGLKRSMDAAEEMREQRMRALKKASKRVRPVGKQRKAVMA
jgi:integrase